MLHYEQGPTVELRDWLMNDLIVELHHSKPDLKEKKHDDESTTLEVMI